MPKLIKGCDLNSTQRERVTSAFPYRWTTENPQRANAYGYCVHCKTAGGKPSPVGTELQKQCCHHHPTMPLQSDAEWIKAHAFYFDADGQLSSGSSYAELHYLAEE